MGKATTKSKPLRMMLLRPAVALILIICAVFIGSIVLSDVFTDLDEAASSSLYRSVINRASELRGVMTDAAGIAVDKSEDVSAQIYEQLMQTDEFDAILDMLSDSPQERTKALKASAEGIREILKLRKVSGAFVCFDVLTSGSESASGRYSVYIRDDSVLSSGYREPKVTLVQGPLNVLDDGDIMKYSHWSDAWTLESEESSAFFFKPLKAAKYYPSRGVSALGYWSQLHVVNFDSTRVITYTVPLISPEGEVFGVLGVEFSASYIQRLIPHSELNHPKESFYALCSSPSAGCDNPRIMSGEYAEQFGSGSKLKLSDKPTLYDNRLFVVGDGNESTKAIAAMGNINLYSINSPYYGDTYTLFGVVKESALFRNSKNLTHYLIYALLIALVLGISGTVYIVSGIAKPIRNVIKRSQSYSGKSGEIFLGRTAIKEIDTLVVTIEDLSTDFLEFSRRIVEAITLTEIPIGVYEIVRESNTVYINKMVAQLCGIDCDGEETFISLDSWEPLINKLKCHKERNSENVYAYNEPGADTRWLRIKTAQQGHKEYGIIIDVTTEILEKMHLELERDVDSLTGLLNRNAFFAQAQAKIEEQPDKLGALIFSDIDNLKSVNEKFGHDAGNHHIFTAAEVFKRFGAHGGIAGRLTSDEFLVFLHGYDSEEKVRDIIHEILGKELSVAYDSLAPSINNLECSTGYSLYPRHATKLDCLMRYAEFAMYEVKHSLKGVVREFSAESYERNRNQTEKDEALNVMIESNTMDYSFQPIVSVKNGRIFAYEALMRPGLDEVQTPQDVIDFARTQAKLYQIERMTYFSTLAWVKDNAYFVGEKKIFINSISGMMLTTRDVQELRDKYNQFMSLLVSEISADEQSDDEFIGTKVGTVRKCRGQIAIDHFTDSIDSDMLIMRTRPEYIKLDETLVRDIHKNEKNQATVREIAEKARSINASLIACCIESVEELDMLIMLGVDYVQGYYISEPISYLEDISKSMTKHILKVKKRRDTAE